MKIFYDWFIHVFKIYKEIYKKNQKPNLIIKLFKRHFAEVVDLEILKNIFADVKEIHNTNYAKTYLNPTNIAAINQMSKNDIPVFRHRQTTEPDHPANPFVKNYPQEPLYATHPPPRRNYPNNQYEGVLHYSKPDTFSAAKKKLNFSKKPGGRQMEPNHFVNYFPTSTLPDPPTLPEEPQHHASSSILTQSHIPTHIPNAANYIRHPNALNGPSSKKPKTNNINIHRPLTPPPADESTFNYFGNLSNVFGHWNEL